MDLVGSIDLPVKDGTAADDDNGHDPAAVANSHPSYSNNDDALICILFPKQRAVKEGRGSSNSEIEVSARAPGAGRPPSFGCLQLSLPNGGK